MPHIPGPGSTGLVSRAQLILGLPQRELAQLLGVSRRTVTRLFASSVVVHSEYLHALARAVHPHDAALATQLAAEGGMTLEQLGIVRPAPPQASPVPAAPVPAAPVPVQPALVPAPRKMPPVRLMVESIVCAAADTMQTPPAAVREVLRAAFARARALDLTIDEIDDVLSPPPPVPDVAAAQPLESRPAPRRRAERVERVERVERAARTGRTGEGRASPGKRATRA